MNFKLSYILVFFLLLLGCVPNKNTEHERSDASSNETNKNSANLDIIGEWESKCTADHSDISKSVISRNKKENSTYYFTDEIKSFDDNCKVLKSISKFSATLILGSNIVGLNNTYAVDFVLNGVTINPLSEESLIQMKNNINCENEFATNYDNDILELCKASPVLKEFGKKRYKTMVITADSILFSEPRPEDGQDESSPEKRSTEYWEATRSYRISK